MPGVPAPLRRRLFRQCAALCGGAGADGAWHGPGFPAAGGGWTALGAGRLPHLLGSIGFSAPTGIAQAPPNFPAPRIRPSVQYCCTRRSDTFHFRAASRTVIYSIDLPLEQLSSLLYAVFRIVARGGFPQVPLSPPQRCSSFFSLVFSNFFTKYIQNSRERILSARKPPMMPPTPCMR